jgi:hypothetical protein
MAAMAPSGRRRVVRTCASALLALAFALMWYRASTRRRDNHDNDTASLSSATSQHPALSSDVHSRAQDTVADAPYPHPGKVYFAAATLPLTIVSRHSCGLHVSLPHPQADAQVFYTLSALGATRNDYT